jgi:hypothetical protein
MEQGQNSPHHWELKTLRPRKGAFLMKISPYWIQVVIAVIVFSILISIMVSILIFWVYLNPYWMQALVSTIMLSVLVIGAHFVQTLTASRMHEVLNEACGLYLHKSAFFEDAKNYVIRRQLFIKNSFGAYILPLLFLFLVIFLLSLGSYFGAEWFYKGELFRSYILGGIYTASDTMGKNELRQYQLSTIFVGTMAFLSAYIWVVYQIMYRINNNDISPFSYYLYSLHILAACLVAGILRHVIEFFPFPGGFRDFAPENFRNFILTGLGILAGVKPTLWLDTLYHEFSTRLRAALGSGDPPMKIDLASIPKFVSLQTICGLESKGNFSVESIERIREIGIDNCEKLATENPLVLWLRTPFGLQTIVDWIAQAQLIILFTPAKIQILREIGINDIFQYYTIINSDGGRAAIANELKIPDSRLLLDGSALEKMPHFAKLYQLRELMAEQSKTQQ